MMENRKGQCSVFPVFGWLRLESPNSCAVAPIHCTVLPISAVGILFIWGGLPKRAEPGFRLVSFCPYPGELSLQGVLIDRQDGGGAGFDLYSGEEPWSAFTGFTGNNWLIVVW